MEKYFNVLSGLLDQIAVTNLQNEKYEIEKAIPATIGLILGQAKKGGKVLFIGNGGSASIASHMAVDFWKNGGIKAMAFNDSSLLTCVSNDYGYPHVFEKPVEMFGEPKDILFAISSSGKSENILRAANAAREKRMRVVTLSGFKEENPLRKMGDINFYVPSSSYGYVEITHLAICHLVVDVIIEKRNE